jgi:hypothetical protein
MRQMENLRDAGLKTRLGGQPSLADEGACSDADEDAAPGRNWSVILIFALVPLVLLITIFFGGFSLVSTAFGAEPAELLASSADSEHYRF